MTFTANGKLLIAGEYFVLDGALSFGLPTQFGQKMTVAERKNGPNIVHWKAFNHAGDLWFEAEMTLSGKISQSTDSITAQRLLEILLAADKLGGLFPKGKIDINTTLDFPNEWGLGTSSTLIYLLANWLKINPYRLLSQTFGGSGYDIACASSDSPILYQRSGNSLFVQPFEFDPGYKQQMAFVYLGQKKDSRQAIQAYRQKGKPSKNLIDEVNQLVLRLVQQRQIGEFCDTVDQLEYLTGTWLGQMPVKQRIFPDFDGSIKSLGAWGGDFVLALSENGLEYIQSYFSKKGLNTILTYDRMVKSS